MNKSTSQFAEGQKARVAFIQARWHKDIVDQGREGFLGEIEQSTSDKLDVDCFEVAGSYDIPLLAKKLTKTRRYCAIVAAGFVVDGGIYRHEFVAQAVISGLMHVQLETEVPIISLVLTPRHFHDHAEHRDFFFTHFREKGVEAARALTASLRALESAA